MLVVILRYWNERNYHKLLLYINIENSCLHEYTCVCLTSDGN